jgi:uncharacterized protein
MPKSIDPAEMVDPPKPAGSEPSEAALSSALALIDTSGFIKASERQDEIFWGPNGLRAGWRLLLFFAVQALAVTVITVLRRLGPTWLSSPANNVSVLTPQYFLITEPIAFAGYFVTTWIMGRVEGRRLADYGLPGRGAFSPRFLIGLLAGFASISALLGAMRVLGVLHFEGVALHGSEAWTYAALWAAAFLLVGLQEEFRFDGGRGYILFTLSTGIGFWPAALLTSIWFGYNHHTNSGETPIGLLSVAAIGVFFCILVRRTGDLWPAIGFHAAWDFGLTYFYGVPDSGLAESGHLLNPRFSGPDWLTGGSAGPEASLLCLMLIVALCAAVLLISPRAKYPNPDAVRDPHRRHRQIPALPAS